MMYNAKKHNIQKVLKMREQEKLERLRNIAEASAKSGLKDHHEYNISYSAIERNSVGSLFLYFTDDDVITEEDKAYFLNYFKDAWKEKEEKVR